MNDIESELSAIETLRGVADRQMSPGEHEVFTGHLDTMKSRLLQKSTNQNITEERHAGADQAIR